MKVSLISGPFGTFLLRAESGADTLIQHDWDFPGLASAFGWQPCWCGETDGTIDCPHRTAEAMIGEARQFLESRLGMRIDDPGYFL